jgi:hypothetical protein
VYTEHPYSALRARELASLVALRAVTEGDRRRKRV